MGFEIPALPDPLVPLKAPKPPHLETSLAQSPPCRVGCCQPAVWAGGDLFSAFGLVMPLQQAHIDPPELRPSDEQWSWKMPACETCPRNAEWCSCPTERLLATRWEQIKLTNFFLRNGRPTRAWRNARCHLCAVDILSSLRASRAVRCARVLCHRQPGRAVRGPKPRLFAERTAKGPPVTFGGGP